MKLNEDLEIHDTLNPKLWDSAGQLLPEVKAAVVQLIKLFEQEIQTPLDIVDVQLVGSNASYNYTEKSDLDIHIIANYELVSKEVELVGMLYQLEKSNFNNKHNITIHGIETELYVQDINSGITSNGIYSVLDNQWIKEPKPIKSISTKNADKEVETWKIHIAKILAEEDEKEIKNTINTLYLIRHNALAAEGEQSKGNQIYRQIRNLGLLDRLKDEYIKLVDKRITVENLNINSYSKGGLINVLNQLYEDKY